MTSLMHQFVSGLKSRSEDTRSKAAQELHHYVTTELREVSLFTGLYVQMLPAFHPVSTYWEIKGMSISYHVYLVWDVKESLSLKWRAGFCLSHHRYHHPFLHSHINELHMDVKQYSIN